MNIRSLGVLWTLFGLCVPLSPANATLRDLNEPPKPKIAKLTPTPHPMLVELQTRLTPVIRESLPYTEIRVEGKRLIMQHRIKHYRTFPVGYGNGTLDPPAQEIGPVKNGLVLQIELMPAPSLQHTPVQLDVRWPHWTTHFQRYEISRLSTGRESQPDVTDTPHNNQYEYVDIQRDHWAYDALGLLSRVGLLDDQAKNINANKPSTRYDFATAVIYALRRYPTVNVQTMADGHLAYRNQTGPVGPTPPNLKVQVQDSFAALSREFRDDIDLLGGHVLPPGLRPERPASQHQCLWMSLSYGAKADVKLMEQIKQTVAAYAAQVNAAQ